ncbi:hypothetical protein BDZ89DRAFT_1142983 [Hymenopellis radicata]|nr:hypothetical protein BDZ89DRAFT_1142983 [Hymenopellis radicata]
MSSFPILSRARYPPLRQRLWGVSPLNRLLCQIYGFGGRISITALGDDDGRMAAPTGMAPFGPSSNTLDNDTGPREPLHRRHVYADNEIRSSDLGWTASRTRPAQNAACLIVDEDRSCLNVPTSSRRGHHEAKSVLPDQHDEDLDDFIDWEDKADDYLGQDGLSKDAITCLLLVFSHHSTSMRCGATAFGLFVGPLLAIFFGFLCLLGSMTRNNGFRQPWG